MPEIMNGTPRLADVVREAGELPQHRLTQVFDEYQQAYWYGAGRLDERGGRSAHSMPHRFGVQRAFGRLHLITGDRGHLPSLKDAWAEFDATLVDESERPAPIVTS